MNRDSNRRHWVAASTAVCLSVFLVHGRSIAHDFVNWDDNLYVVENPAVVTPSRVPWWHHLLTPSLGYPIPVTIATYQVEHALFGLDPAPFHATNVALHALVALTAMAALRRWSAGPTGGPWIAALVASGFALHPATVEPVAWVSGRKELLAALFSLLALASMPRPVHDAGGDEKMSDAGNRTRSAATVFVILAFLSKPSTLLVPLLLALLDRGHRRLWGTVSGLGAGLAALSFFLERDVGAISPGHGVGDVVARVLASAARHALIVVFPFDLAPKYLDPPDGPGPLLLTSGAVVLMAFCALALLAWRFRHPSWPGLALAALAYAPSSGIIPLNREYSDSYVYLPLAGLAMALGATLPGTLRSIRRGVRTLALVVGLTGIAALAMTSAAQAATWRDGVSLWTALYRRYPDSPQVCRNLGNAWMFGRTFRPERAVAVYRLCIQTLGHEPFFLKNLAIASFHAGDLDEAERLFHALLIDHPSDDVALKYMNEIINRRRGVGTPQRPVEPRAHFADPEGAAWTNGP